MTWVMRISDLSGLAIFQLLISIDWLRKVAGLRICRQRPGMFGILGGFADGDPVHSTGDHGAYSPKAIEGIHERK